MQLLFFYNSDGQTRICFIEIIITKWVYSTPRGRGYIVLGRGYIIPEARLCCPWAVALLLSGDLVMLVACEGGELEQVGAVLLNS